MSRRGLPSVFRVILNKPESKLLLAKLKGRIILFILFCLIYGYCLSLYGDYLDIELTLITLRPIVITKDILH